MRRWLVPIALSMVLVAFGFAALDQYNVTWDEALGDFFFGQRYLMFWATGGDGVWLDFGVDPPLPPGLPDLASSEFRSVPAEHFPVASTLAAAVSWVATRTGLTDAFDGYHLLNLLLAVILVVVLYRTAEEEIGSIGAVAALLLLFTSPRVVFHMMANIKDFPEMVFFTLTLVVFFRAWRRGSAAGLVAAGVLWGLALGTKPNAAFIPIVLLPLMIATPVPPEQRRRRRWMWAVGAALVAVVVFVAAWPWLWTNPFERLAVTLHYLSQRALRASVRGNAPAFSMLLWTTPIPLLAASLAGIVILVGRAARRQPFAILLVSWIVVVLGRAVTTSNLDGVRHFLELQPALALSAGTAVAALGAFASSRLPRLRKMIAPLLVCALVVPQAFALVRVHPFEIAWWNSIAGGIAGARARGVPQGGDYWAASYRLGMRWLDVHAPRDTQLVVPIAGHAVRLVARERLRPDIRLVPSRLPRNVPVKVVRDRLDELAAQGPVDIMFVPRADWLNQLTRLAEQEGELQVEWSLEGEPILKIIRWRRLNDPKK